MHDEHPHPLLAQLPLTVSPFLALPTATTLPYTYKQLPSTLPPSLLTTNQQQPHPQSTPSNHTTSSSTDPQPQPPKPTYITSSSGHTAHPDDIIGSCRALQAHLLKMEEEGKRRVKEWEEKRREAELAEKRRVAPGWLDQEVRLLVPEKRYQEGGDLGGVSLLDRMDEGEGHGVQAQGQAGNGETREAEELDRAFGGMGIR